MALKPDRDYYGQEDISNFWQSDESASQDVGGIASVVTQGSGVALDAPQNVVAYIVNPSGAVPRGVLLSPIKVYADTNRFYRNFYRNEVLPGEKVCLFRKGWLVTDKIVGTPAAGGTAYLGASGNFAATQATGAPTVGKFETTKDQNGFARVYVDL